MSVRNALTFLLIATLLGCAKPPGSIAAQKAALIGTWNTGGPISSRLVFRSDSTFEWSYDTGPGTLGMAADSPVTTAGLAGTFAEDHGTIRVSITRYIFRSPDAVTEQKFKNAIEQQEPTHLSGEVVFESPTRLHILWTSPKGDAKKAPGASFDKE